MDAFAGIDVAFAKRKRLPVCVATWQHGRLVPLPLADRSAPPSPRGSGNVATLDSATVDTFADETARYLRAVEEHFGVAIRRIAIDAPSDPKPHGVKRRRSECCLDNQKISCFTTPGLEEFAAIQTKVRAHLDGGGEHSRLPH